MAATEIERLLVRMIGDGTSYQKMLRDAQRGAKRTAQVVETASKKIERIAKSLHKFGASVSRLGRSLSLRLTAPLTIIGGLAVRSFAKFDQAMTESTSIMKVTEEQTKRMRDTAISLSGRAVQSSTELAESYFFLASAGKSAEQSMSLLPKVAEFATAGTFDMALATDLLTDAQSALGLSSKNVAQDTKNLARVSDVLVKANTLANASVQQFATALTSKAGAAMKSFNIDLEEGVGVLAAMADQGIKAELAGNAFDRIIRLLAKSSRDNTKAFEKFGFSVFDLAGNFRSQADIMENLEDITRTMSAETKSATLEMLGFEARVQGVILPLIGTSKAMRFYTKELRDAKGITKEVADRQMKSFTNQMKLLRNQISNVGIEIGEILAPMLTKVGEVLKEGIRLWKGLDLAVKKTIVIIGVLTALVGPLLISFGGLVALTGFAVTGMAAMVAVVGKLLSPFILITAAIVAGTAALLHWTGAGAIALEWFGRQWASLMELIKPAIDGIKNALGAGDLQLAVKIAWAQIRLSWAEGIAPLQEAWAGFVFEFKSVFAEAINFIGRAFVRTTGFITRAVVLAQAKLQGFTKQQTKFALLGVNIAQGLVQTSLNQTRTQALSAARKGVASDVKAIQANIRALQGERNALVTTATIAASEAMGSAGAPATAAVTAVKPPPIPTIPKPPTRHGLGRVTGVRFGSLEAQQRIAEFRSLRGGGEKEGVAKSNELLERVAVATETVAEGPADKLFLAADLQSRR